MQCQYTKTNKNSTWIKMARIFYQFTTISIIIIYNYQISNYIKNISDKNILGKRDICYNLVCKKIVWEIQHNNMSLKNCYEKCHIVAVSFTILESTSYSMEKSIWRKKINRKRNLISGIFSRYGASSFVCTKE